MVKPREPRGPVAHGSRNGTTAEIGETLSKAGCATAVSPAREAPADASAYDAGVLGGALSSGHGHRYARRFPRSSGPRLASRPLWLSSSGPPDVSAAELDILPVPGAREHVTFGGRPDEPGTSRDLNPAERPGAHVQGRTARVIVHAGKGGDFRDLDRITGWAAPIAREPLVARSGPGDREGE